MKTLCIVPILMLLLVTGCREITQKTEIHRDGSVLRTITMRQGSGNEASAVYPFPADSSWNITAEPDSSDKEKVIHKAVRIFSDMSLLNTHYKRFDTSDIHIRITVRLDKKFRWFVTYFDFRETWKKLNPFPPVPITNYLSPREMELHFQGVDEEEREIDMSRLDFTHVQQLPADTGSINERFEAWMIRSVFEAYFQVLVDAAGTLTDPDLKERALGRKETFFKAFIKEIDGDADAESLIRICAETLDHRDVYAVSDQLREAYQRVEHQYLRVTDALDDSYTATAVMPGLLIDANCDAVLGNEAEWTINPDRFLISDYEMTAESRVMNLWAVIVSGAAVLVLIILLLIPRRRK